MSKRSEPLGIRLGGLGPGGKPRLHYPDLLVQTAGCRVALELELSPKGRARREGILAGYGADRRIDAVFYLLESGAMAGAIRSAARRMGVAPLVHVQRLQSPRARSSRVRQRVPERTAARSEASR